MPNRTVRSHSFSGRSGTARPTIWLGSADQTGQTVLAAATSVLDQSFTDSQLAAVAQAGGTIVRTRGTLWVKTDQLVQSEAALGALGMMVVKETARAAGVASIPTPVTESPNDAFFVHQWWQAGMFFNQVDATGVQIGLIWSRYDFDSKAQRKFTEGDAIVVTMENINATFGVVYQLMFRMLIKPGVSK